MEIVESQWALVGLDAAQALAAVALALTSCWTSYLLGLRLSPEAPVSVRLAGAVVALGWLATALFWLLVPFGLFRLDVALVAWGGLCAVAHRLFGRRLDARSRLRRDLRAGVRALAALARRPPGWALAATFAVALVRCIRGLASPPLGWDALTYHLYKAGRWVQLGDLAAQSAPNAWQHFEYYPVVGDVFWAWSMLPVRSDALITPAGTAVWLALVLGLYALARELGATRDHATLAASLTGALPASMAYLSSGYVDNTTAALFVLGALFTVRVVRRGALVEAWLAVGALALMLGTKLTTAAYFALGALFVFWALARSDAPARRRRIVALGCLVAVVVGAPTYLRAWVERGSPFYPFRIAFGGVTLSEGYSGAREADRALRVSHLYSLDSPLDFWAYFLARTKSSGAFVNPGPGAAILTLLTLLGAFELVRRRGSRLGAVFLLGCGLLTIGGFLSGNMTTFRQTIKASTAGRYVLPGLAGAAALGAGWSSRLARSLWLPAILVSVLFCVPRGWAAAEAVPVAAVGGVVLVMAGGTWLAVHRHRRTGRRRGALAAALVLVVAAEVSVERVRADARYPIYEAAADLADPVFHMHSLRWTYAAAWHLWEALDDGIPHRLAVTAGWDGLGHNWYRYPLLGTRLQNDVLYIPVTRQGTIVDYDREEELHRRAEFLWWLRRLVERDVDHVVSLAPRTTIEDRWMRAHPELFRPVAGDPRELHVAYRLDVAAARSMLSRRGAAPRPASHRTSS